MKNENQLTKNVNYYTLIYREVGIITTHKLEGGNDRQDKQPKKPKPRQLCFVYMKKMFEGKKERREKKEVILK
jgi:hypothetical protein